MPEQPEPGLDIESSARAVRIDIRDGARSGAQALTHFAERFAADPALRDEALVLRMAAPEQGSGAAHPTLEREMLELVDRIVADYADGGAEALRQRERTYSQLREHVLRKAPSEELAFVGEGITKAYRGSDFALATLDLTLRLGQITGVVGQNAHGKTTLLRIVAGELRPDQGTLAYPLLGEGGERIDWVRVKRSLAFVPQELPAWRGSLRDTLHFEAALRGIRGARNESEVNFVIERLGLGDHLGKTWSQLSGGYKLRFALARALVWKPRILVMDEPLANLDIKAKSVLLQDVRDLARSYRYPIAVLMSSHELYALETVCQQMVFLNQGQVVYVGPADAVGSDLERNEYELRTSLKLSELQDRLRGTGVEEVREDGGNLTLRTVRSMDHQSLLRLLIDRGVDIQAFRDNSRSVRRLFQ
ncbi:MAG: ATP-binding cassette domain-containing protein [Pseudomonadota bacterium]|nr:ATP-binding cassette domain-containing protein [Gammaproteobacteria bacterium]MDQ3582069.1 ATP-binding cassette domain-containing protein [Pseudomonadota bacterium]